MLRVAEVTRISETEIDDLIADEKKCDAVRAMAAKPEGKARPRGQQEAGVCGHAGGPALSQERKLGGDGSLPRLLVATQVNQVSQVTQVTQVSQVAHNQVTQVSQVTQVTQVK